jgi:hypothetical protein
MTRRSVTHIGALSLCLASATPAFAQEYRFAPSNGPRGANATINLRIPLGVDSRRARPTFGLTVGFGRTLGAATDGQPIVRQTPLADFRLSATGLVNARVASFDLANVDRNRRLNASGGKSPLFLAGGAAAAAAIACLILGCFDGDDESETPGENGDSTAGPG